MKRGLRLFLFVLIALMVKPFITYAEIETIDVNKAEEYLKAGYTIIDVRDKDEFKSGHIKGAINIDYYNDEFEKLFQEKLKDKNKEYVLYCRSGMRSLYASPILEELGYTKIKNMKGGIIAWKESGKPVE